MNSKFEQQKELLQNAANDLNLIIHLYIDYSDKRKKPSFCVYSGNLSISGKMDYQQTNMYLLGFRNAIKINHCR